MTNIEKIKDMMLNELWMEAIDSVTELVIAAANAKKEVDALKEQNEAIINERNELLNKLEAINKDYQSALSDKVALIESVNKTEALVDLYRQKAVAANGMYHHEHTKNKEHEALVNKCNKLHIENNELKENNKELKEQNAALKDAIAEMAEKATNPDYVKFLEMAKKFQKYNIAEHLDALEEFQSARNLNIENPYITNNYFSEEDKSDG